jgi:hypothetical protein
VTLLVLNTTLALNWKCDEARIMPQEDHRIAYRCVRFSSKRQEMGDRPRRQTELAEEYFSEWGIFFTLKRAKPWYQRLSRK